MLKACNDRHASSRGCALTVGGEMAERATEPISGRFAQACL